MRYSFHYLQLQSFTVVNWSSTSIQGEIENQTMSSKKKNKLKKKLDLEDVFCIACRCIYLRPVTMPCDHTVCLDCFKNMVNITSYQCPICRKRISNWLRKFKHNWDALVNEKLWEDVQQQFPVEVQKRQNGEDDGLEETIVGQGFIRVENKEGEIKKEFDSMIVNFQQEQEKIELRNLELAKKLQEDEEAESKSHQLLCDQIVQEDVKLALIIQENIKQELQQEETLLNESDKDLAKKLQDQMESELTQANVSEQNTLSASNKIKLPKTGPLDKIFSKLSQTTNVQCNTIDNCLPNNCSQLSNTSSLISSPSTSSSSLIIDSTATTSNEIIKNDIFNDCTCGRLNDCNSNIPPCTFCHDQITLFNQLVIHKKTDYSMAKNLDNSFRRENFKDYSLRKRPNSTQSSGERKKMMKLSGQQTLENVLEKLNHKKLF